MIFKYHLVIQLLKQILNQIKIIYLQQQTLVLYTLQLLYFKFKSIPRANLSSIDINFQYSMGNQQATSAISNKISQNINFQNAHVTRLHQVEKGTLLKCQVINQPLTYQKKNQEQDNCTSSSSYYLQKTLLTDSHQQYKLLSTYLQHQSLSNHQPSQILKIVKIYQQAQRGFCSNHFMIRILFQHSDITIRDQLRVRAMKKSLLQLSDNNSPYFQYCDLCSIMFACLSALYAVEKMCENFISFVKKHISTTECSFKHLDSMMHQFKINIPFNLDRLIIMPDGTIKSMHPLVLDHNNRTSFTNQFFYSPQKMKDFLFDDGIKGRIFQTAIIVLQCALIEDTQEMNKIYNGYCINQSLLNQKIQSAIQIYTQLQTLTREDLRLFKMIKKMTTTNAQQRIGLKDCIREAQDLFQLNKKLKETTSQNISPKKHKDPQQRMSIEDLQFIASHRMTLKSSPMQNSTAQNTACANSKFYRKTTSRQNSVRRVQTKEGRQNPEIQITNFDLHGQAQREMSKNFQSTSKNPFGSLLINNGHQNFNKPNNECLQSLFAQESNIHETRKQNFFDSKFEYGKFYCNPIKNKIMKDKDDLKNSLTKKSLSSHSGKQMQYKKMFQQSIKNPSKERQSSNFSKKPIRQNLLRSKTKNIQNSVITTSKFMDNDKIYLKYDFIEKSDEKNDDQLTRQAKKQNVINMQDQMNEHNQEYHISSKQSSINPYKFQPQTFQHDQNINSTSSNNPFQNSSNNHSQVLQKLTSVHINERIRKHRILRQSNNSKR